MVGPIWMIPTPWNFNSSPGMKQITLQIRIMRTPFLAKKTSFQNSSKRIRFCLGIIYSCIRQPLPSHRQEANNEGCSFPSGHLQRVPSATCLKSASFTSIDGKQGRQCERLRKCVGRIHLGSKKVYAQMPNSPMKYSVENISWMNTKGRLFWCLSQPRDIFLLPTGTGVLCIECDGSKRGFNILPTFWVRLNLFDIIFFSTNFGSSKSHSSISKP